ncbi:MAG TPA: hypothetical protein VGF94_19780 [Kofleriaceae bacterium]|jgi:serine/threonine-protein kinase
MSRFGTIAVPAGFRDSPDRALAIGEVVASAYQVHDEIARTDTGIVYEARDLQLDRLVAIKVGWRDPGTPSLAVEARRCAAVRDPCAVQVHAIGTHHGAEFAVGERVIGRLLRDELIEPLPVEVYLARLRALVGAVARAHEAGIAVGDLSGASVLVTSEGRMVLGRLSLSQVPAFGAQVVAPEVARGDVSADDPGAAEAIDLFALGCLAIELARGTPPHAAEPPPRLGDLRPDLPDELADVVAWLIAPDPTARPRSARDVLSQLDAIAERSAARVRTVRVLVVDDDLGRARWLRSLARRGHAGAIVEIATEGTDAAHKLVRDMPDLVFIDATLTGVMNALELCMYARGLDDQIGGKLCLVGEVSARDHALLAEATARFLPDDARLADAVLDIVRDSATAALRARRPSKVTG